MRKYLVINTLMIFDISDEKTEVVQDSPAVVQTPEVEAVVEVEDEQPQKSPDVSQRFHHSLRKVCTRVRDGFSYFRSGGWINIWGGGVLLLALAGAWWQCPERPREKFNKICFLGLHGEI